MSKDFKITPGSSIESRQMNENFDVMRNVIDKAVAYNEYLAKRQKVFNTFAQNLRSDTPANIAAALIGTYITSYPAESVADSSQVEATGTFMHLETAGKIDYVLYDYNAYDEKLPVGAKITDAEGNLLCDHESIPWAIVSPDTIWCVNTAEYPELETINLSLKNRDMRVNFCAVEMLPVSGASSFEFQDKSNESAITFDTVATREVSNKPFNFNGKVKITTPPESIAGINKLYMQNHKYAHTSGSLLFKYSGLDAISEIRVNAIKADHQTSLADALTLTIYSSADDTLNLNTISSGGDVAQRVTSVNTTNTFSTPVSIPGTYTYIKVDITGSENNSPIFNNLTIVKG